MTRSVTIVNTSNWEHEDVEIVDIAAYQISTNTAGLPEDTGDCIPDDLMALGGRDESR